MQKQLVLWVLLLLGFVLGFMWVGFSEENTGFRITYDVGGSPVVFLRDSGGMVQVNGLDVPGLVMYHPLTKTVYYQHPAWPRFLAVGPEAFAEIPQQAYGVAGDRWTPFMDKPVRRWELSVKGDEGDEACGSWFGSPGVGAVIGMDAGDFMRILGTVNWLTGGKNIPCHVMMPPAKDAELEWGWPVRWQDDHVTWQLREVSRVGLSDLILPADVQPVDTQARLAILLSQLTLDEKRAFLNEGRKLPIEEQLKLLEEVLAEGAD